tara:strand:+ start:2764 stop:3603 length:840 start_codon:yes stop_codon:yes gene_type:complete
MILIVESGSTKADWVVVDNKGVLLSFKTKGWNLMLLEQEEMLFRLEKLVQLTSYKNKIRSIYFYAPGVSLEGSANSLQKVLTLTFKNAKIEIQSDLLAAARSVYTGKPLFVSILGTGSNTAFFDGQVLIQNTPSLGFILGDEGSGACLGKELLKCYLYKTLPKDLYVSFSKSHSISKENVLKATYIDPNPNRFFAAYVPFLVVHKNHPFIQTLVSTHFENYLKVHILSNESKEDYPIAFIGSVAYLFSDILTALCRKYALNKILFNQFPLPGLLNYHLS